MAEKGRLEPLKSPLSDYHVTFANGQASDIEMEEGTREAVEWFILSDCPDATFAWDASGRVKDWENAEARHRGELPIVYVEPLG